MKKTVVNLPLLAILAVSPVCAEATETFNGWYLSGNFASLSYKEISTEHTIVSVTGGYTFTDYLSAEFTFGRGVSGHNEDVVTITGQEQSQQDINALYGAALRLSYPVMDAVDVTGTIGYVGIDTEYTITRSGSGSADIQFDQNTDGLSYSVGLIYAFTDKVSASLEYQILPDHEPGAVERTSTNVGVTYHF